jgi:hypothetical protein
MVMAWSGGRGRDEFDEEPAVLITRGLRLF